jgi:hypothetical protein
MVVEVPPGCVVITSREVDGRIAWLVWERTVPDDGSLARGSHLVRPKGKHLHSAQTSVNTRWKYRSMQVSRGCRGQEVGLSRRTGH